MATQNHYIIAIELCTSLLCILYLSFFENSNLSLLSFSPFSSSFSRSRRTTHSVLLFSQRNFNLAFEFFSSSPTQVFFLQPSKAPTQKSLSSSNASSRKFVSTLHIHIVDLLQEQVFRKGKNSLQNGHSKRKSPTDILV